MKRSEINSIMREAIAFLNEKQFALPPFAYWTPEDWKTKGAESVEVVQNQLGWDITDFGAGDYESTGLLMFTLRNGGLEPDCPKTYCEKIMIVKEDQVTPPHFHWNKVEDIINRGGGRLLIELYNSTADDALADTPVTLSMDAVQRTMDAGTVVGLDVGESITLPQRVYHKFWAEAGKGTALIGEVSKVNDDQTDNRFHEKVGRFPKIEEDEPPLHLLCGDYPSVDEMMARG